MLWITLFVASLFFVAVGAIGYFLVREREEEAGREPSAVVAAAQPAERGSSASSRP